MGFMQNIAERMYGRDSASVDQELIDTIIDDERRRRSDGLNDAEITLLEKLARSSTRRLPGDDVAIRLLEQQLILSYLNQDVWYLPHPLLMLTLIRPGSPESEASDFLPVYAEQVQQW